MERFAQLNTRIPSLRILHAVAGTAILGLLASTASAQNLIANDSFEYYGQFGDEWTVAAGTPDLYTGGFISRTPRCGNVIGLRYESFLLDAIRQSRTALWQDSGSYLAYADIAGDRSVFPAPWVTSLGIKLEAGTQTVHKSIPAPVPFAGINNTNIKNASWYPRLAGFKANIPYLSNYKVTLHDNDDRGVLADNVHLFPLYWDDCTCGWPLGLAGFSVETDYWSGLGPKPIEHLYRGTASGCCGPIGCDNVNYDNDVVWIWNKECDHKVTMMIAGWTFCDQGTNAPNTLKLDLELQATQGTPGFVVQFYDWKLQRWVGASALTGGNSSKSFPGGQVTATPQCFTVDWTQYMCPQPGNSTLNTPLGDYVSHQVNNGSFAPFNNVNLVLARITFGVCPEWLCMVDWPPPPPQDFIVKVHHAKIVASNP